MNSRGGMRPGAGRPKGLGPYGEATKPIRIPVSLIGQVTQFIANEGYQIPLYSSKVQAGFPSPADDYVEAKLDLNQYLIKHPSATFLVRATGESMIGAGIFDGDLLIVDRSLEPCNGKIVIAAVEGYLTVKRLKIKNNTLYLIAENKDFPPIEINPEIGVYIWGVVTQVIRSLR